MSRLVLAVVLFAIVAFFGMQARAQSSGYTQAVSYFPGPAPSCSATPHPDSPVYSTSPVEVAGEVRAMSLSSDPGCTGGFTGAFTHLRRTSGSASSALFQGGDGSSNLWGTIGKYLSGETCWENVKSSMMPGTWYAISDPIFAACEVCPSPKEWNPTNARCEMPECDVGEVWDDAISACRAECEENEVYLYESSTCKLQCTPGKTAARGYLSNKRLDVQGEVFTVNGCPATAHVNCQPDTEGLILEKFGAQHVTGQFCKIHFVYNQEIEQTVEFQVVYEDELEGELGYQGEEAADPALDGQFEEPAAKETVTYNASLEQFNSANWKYVCNNGTAAWVYQVDGVDGQVEMAGACPVDDEEVDPAVASPQAIQPQLQGIAEAQQEQTDILDEVKNMLASLTSGDTNISLNWGTWSDPADPDGYEKQHEDGLEGVVGELPNLEGTEIGSYLNSIVPDFGAIEAPECFTFEIPIPFVATVPFEPPCWMWDFLRTFVIFSAYFSAWAIMFIRP